MSVPNLSRGALNGGSTDGNTVALDLATLTNFDPSGGRGAGLNRRFCCPLCGLEKPRDLAHRSLIYRADSGAWNCKRCGASGKLRDFWDTRPDRSNGPTPPSGSTGANGSRSNWRRARAQSERAQLSRLRGSAERDDDPQAVHPAPSAQPATPSGAAKDWRANLRGVRPLDGTPGAAYLSGRGVPLDVADLAGVSFSPNWFGRAAVVFAIHGRSGELVAAQGRRIEATATGQPNALTSGPKSRGLFVAPAFVGGRVWHPFDADGPGVILCESPIDALSLAACSFPAVALCGINGEATTGPAWLPLVCGLKSVYLAFDADDAGDGAARALSARLGVYGARCATLRPEGAKDWNEALQARGSDALGDWIAARVL